MPVTFTSFPRSPATIEVIHAYDDDDQENYLDDSNALSGGSLTCPGQTLTSTQAFMR
jgi:hypothetical protein